MHITYYMQIIRWSHCQRKVAFFFWKCINFSDTTYTANRVPRLTLPCRNWCFWHGFTEMVVTPLIIVRFERFENWHSQDCNTYSEKLVMTSRPTSCARWRHARDDVIIATVNLQSLILTVVAKQLLWAYLKNRWVDFAHFWQAGRYGQVDFTEKNSLLSDHPGSF